MKCLRFFQKQQASSLLGRSFSLHARCGELAMLFVIWTIGCLLLNASGCTVKGFQNVPNNQPTTPSQLRSAAAVARAEAQALDAIAAEQQGVIDRTVSMVTQASDSIGAPAAISGLLGAAAGWMVPTPGSKRRERLAKAEGAAGRVLPPPT